MEDIKRINFQLYVSRTIKDINKIFILLGYKIVELNSIILEQRLLKFNKGSQKTNFSMFSIFNEYEEELGILDIDPNSNRKLIFSNAKTLVSYERYIDREIEEEKREITREIYTTYSSEEVSDGITKIIAIHKGSKEDPNYRHIDVTIKVGPFDSEDNEPFLKISISPNNILGLSNLSKPQIIFCYDINNDSDNQTDNSLENAINTLPEKDKCSFEEIIEYMEELAIPGLREFINEFAKENKNIKTGHPHTYKDEGQQ